MSFISFTKLAKFRLAEDFARFREMGSPFCAVANYPTTLQMVEIVPAPVTFPGDPTLILCGENLGDLGPSVA
jgi:hypothetical protein